MPLVLLVVTLVVSGVIAAFALGFVRGGLADPPASRPDHALPPDRLTAGDVAGVRFSVALRGYRMEEVDAFIDRILDELHAQQAELNALRADPGAGADLPPEAHA